MASCFNSEGSSESAILWTVVPLKSINIFIIESSSTSEPDAASK